MHHLLFIGGLGGWEVLLIVAIVVLLFGAKKIPELARGLGSGIREFKNATTEHLQEEKTTTTPPEREEVKKETAATATTPPVTEDPTKDFTAQERPENTTARHA